MSEIDNASTVFRVSGRKFFDPQVWRAFETNEKVVVPAFPQGVGATLERFQGLQRDPMEQLADWAEVDATSAVCSVGGGWGYEEVVFFNRGAHISILDIDEYRVLRPLAEGGYFRMNDGPADSGSERSIELMIRDFSRGLPTRKFDVIYVSSLTPNDLRLGDMIRFRGRTAFNAFLNRSAQLAGMLLGRRWRFFPPWEEPILPSLARFAEEVLSPGGRLLIKFYACPPVTRSRWYIPSLKRQLARHGFALVSVIRNDSVHQRHALLAVKLGSPEADAMVARLSKRGTVVRNLAVRDSNPHEVREIYSARVS
jgi:hypothetical protein